MSETVVNPSDLIKMDHINKMKSMFKEPGQMGWSKTGIEQLDLLYKIALQEDPQDPIGWVDALNRSHPAVMEVGSEKTRIGKILVMADIMLKQRQRKIEKRDDMNRPKI